LAVIPVIFYHAGFKLFGGGYIGVDIFFVISGYLITTIIFAELEAGTFSLINFYERRARRILPALVVVMFACLPFSWFWLLPDSMKQFSQSLVAVSTFASNILFWLTSGYFDISTELKPLIHTWSLAVEEQYYVLFPLFLMLTWKLGKRWIVGLLVLVFFISLVGAQWLSVTHPSFNFYMLPTRGWELLIGAFIAFHYTQQNIKKHNQLIEQLGSLFGLLLIAYSIFAYNDRTPFPSVYALVPTLGAALIIIFATHKTVVGKLLGSKLFVAIGLVSYSAYLWHQPMFAFVRERSLDEPSMYLMSALALLSFAFAYLSWKYVERPFRNKHLISRYQVFSYGVLCSAFFIGIGLVGHLNGGFKMRFDFKEKYQGDVQHLDFHKYISDKYVTCTPKSIANNALQWEGYIRCMQSKQGYKVDIALIGDSHAEHLFIGLADNLPSKNVAFYIKNSPPFVSNEEFDEIFKHVLDTKSIDTVIVSMRWSSRLSQVPRSSSLQLELKETLQLLINNGKKVYLVDDVPHFPFPSERCKFIYDNFLQSACTTNAMPIFDNEKKYEATLKNTLSLFPSIKFIKLRDLFCNENECNMVNNDLLMFRDNNHLNILGSKFVGAEIIRRHPELNE
jgi:peptidoglycan/LPS O-acetylase OafA/YrhL